MAIRIRVHLYPLVPIRSGFVIQNTSTFFFTKSMRHEPPTSDTTRQWATLSDTKRHWPPTGALPPKTGCMIRAMKEIKEFNLAMRAIVSVSHYPFAVIRVNSPAAPELSSKRLAVGKSVNIFLRKFRMHRGAGRCISVHRHATRCSLFPQRHQSPKVRCITVA